MIRESGLTITELELDGMTSTSASFVSTLTRHVDFDRTTAASEAQLPLKGGVSTVDESAVPRSSVKLIDGFSQSKSDTGKPAVCFSKLEYCDILIEGHPKPITALKNKGAEIYLIREDIVRNWETSPTPIGSVKIRGIFWGASRRRIGLSQGQATPRRWL